MIVSTLTVGRRWSDKPLIEYSGYSVWPNQLAAFIKEVVGEPAVLVGNSLGGYAAMATAAQHPDLVRPPCDRGAPAGQPGAVWLGVCRALRTYQLPW